jgi:L-malate glycosyltransferase
MVEPVRVLWLIKGLGPGGAERLLTSMAAVSGGGRFVYEAAYLLPGKSHLAAELERAGVAVTCLDAPDERNPAWTARLRRLLADRRYDAVHVHSPYVAGLARPVIASLPARVRPAVVSTEHNVWWSYAAPSRVLNAQTCRSDVARIAVSADVRASMPASLRPGVEVLEHGVDLARVRAHADARDETRAELGVADGDVLVGTVANYREKKAYPDLLDAARQALDTEPSLRFVAVGQGPLATQIERRHAELGLGDRFRLLGRRDDAVRVLAACDVFTLASRNEGLPVALMEALALGLPVAATAVGGIPEAVDDGVHGVLVPPGRPGQLARAYVDLARDPGRRGAMSTEARTRSERFDARRAAARIEEVYADAVARNPARRPAAWRLRGTLKRNLARPASTSAGTGLTLLIYHRVGGGTNDERDLPVEQFRAQLDVLADHRVVALDTALDELDAGDDREKIVLTFDDGFADVHDTALPLLADRRLPFTLYLTTGYVGRQMHWDGSMASAPGPALDWKQLEALRDSGLCTIGNHTQTHPRPEGLTTDELDAATFDCEQRLGVRPRHFSYTWGVPTPALRDALRIRFRSAATGRVGRNRPGTDRMLLHRVPARQSDPIDFFAAKLHGRLLPERAYGGVVAAAKLAGFRG